MINPLEYFYDLVLPNLYIIGNKNAAVLPEPVQELARTSLPANITGIIFAYMFVGCEYPYSWHAFTKALFNLSYENSVFTANIFGSNSIYYSSSFSNSSSFYNSSSYSIYY